MQIDQFYNAWIYLELHKLSEQIKFEISAIFIGLLQ